MAQGVKARQKVFFFAFLLDNASKANLRDVEESYTETLEIHNSINQKTAIY